MKKPPKRYLRKYNKKFRYYLGRVHEIIGNTLSLTIWEQFGDKREFYALPTIKTEGVTYTGKFHCGTPVEIWTWTETVHDKDIERLHIKGLKC